MNILKQISYDIWCLIKLFLFFMLDQIIASLIVWQQTQHLPSLMLKRWYFVFYLTSFVIIAFMLWRYYRQLHNHNYEKYRPHWPNWHDVKIIISGLLSIFIMEIALNILSIHLHVQTANDSANQQMVNQLTQGNPQAMFWFGVIFAPIMEELIFRGFFFNYFFKHMHGKSALLAIIIDGCIFGCMHEQTHFMSWLVYAILGCILATCYYRSKNIYVSMSVHILNNLIASI
ncbi:MAG: CPBP family intramembrane metalloprotease [Candidatus Paralactobacillus gallistercoris]|uniref:CPBP family intramembrane metalloprotease n=1 Tax=Candidatus Paralactobacillus gallistercoris TaxID=2838724 RepID=A0A948X1D9_9LACO|nr:CPBP family intramembrane metalloprotease [Candidatus Paralactobacillus gallistercoris]